MWTTLLINLVSTVQKTQMRKKFTGRWRFCITIRTSETRLKFEFKKNWRNRVFCLNSDRKRTKNRGKTEHRSADRTKRGSEIRSLFFQKKKLFLTYQILEPKWLQFQFWAVFSFWHVLTKFSPFSDFLRFYSILINSVILNFFPFENFLYFYFCESN